MVETEIKKYRSLNTLAEHSGIVIFGGSEDKDIPTCELRQAFAIESDIYNRSIDSLSIKDALSAYDTCVTGLCADTVLLHIGAADIEYFKQDAAAFDQKYRELICHIRELDRKCRIAVISLKNYDEDPDISELNKHLKYISESEQCEYGDIAAKKVWSPKSTREAVSFVYSIGFVHPLNNERPLQDLIKILFCEE